MNNENVTYLTKSGLKKLEDELSYLTTVRRAEVAERLHQAQEDGDLIENAEYEAAKNEQSFVEGRIVTIQSMLSRAAVIKKGKNDGVAKVGSTVVVKENNSDKEAFVIVGATESDPIEIAKIEADKIADLSGRLDLRVHVVGDCSDPVSASIVGSAMVQYDNKPNRRGKSWTYTHAWQQVPASSWNGASVLASVDSEDQIQSARDQGYAPAVIVPVFLNGSKPMKVNGTKLIPCKNQIDKSITCVDCRLCFDASKLFDRKLGIAFTPDAGTKKRIG